MISTISSLFKLAGVVLVSDRYEFKGDVDQPDHTGTGNDDSTKQAEQLIPVNDRDVELNSDGAATSTSSAATTLQSKRRRNRQKQRLRKGSIDHKVRFESVEVIHFERSLGLHCLPANGKYPLGLGQEIDRVVVDLDTYTASKNVDLIQRAKVLGIPVPTATSVDILEESLQTRQYDFKHGKSNKLFATTTEDERKHIILRSSSLSAELLSREYEEYIQLAKSIRQSREITGCSCKSLKVDKLSIAKLRTELVHFGQTSGFRQKSDVENLSKSELQKNLRAVLKTCHLCIANSCECVALEVECSAEVCGCLRGGITGNQTQICCNPCGQSIFNPDLVQEFRDRLLSTEISSSNA